MNKTFIELSDDYEGLKYRNQNNFVALLYSRFILLLCILFYQFQRNTGSINQQIKSISIHINIFVINRFVGLKSNYVET